MDFAAAGSPAPSGAAEENDARARAAPSSAAPTGTPKRHCRGTRRQCDARRRGAMWVCAALCGAGLAADARHAWTGARLTSEAPSDEIARGGDQTLRRLLVDDLFIQKKTRCQKEGKEGADDKKKTCDNKPMIIFHMRGAGASSLRF